MEATRIVPEATDPDGSAADTAVPPRLALPAAPTVTVVTGHYGSGKTEFSVCLAMALARAGRRVALGDLDIVNPYFRSRERAEVMEAAGIQVVSSSLGHNVTLDLPAVSARIRGPLHDPGCDTILDVGGNSIGAKVLVEFGADIARRGYDMLLVVNAYRPETRDVAGVLAQLAAIEGTSNLRCTGLVSNTHLLRETRGDDVLAGYRLTKAVADETGLPVRYVSAIGTALAEVTEDMDGVRLPIGMYMREHWM